jgi:diguanylate cyclase (GGDEF)-like protein
VLGAAALGLATPADGPTEGPAAVLARAESLVDSDPSAAETLAGQALEFAREQDNDGTQLEALATLGRVALRADRPADAISRLEEARALASDSGITTQNGVISRALGDARFRLGEYDSALQNFLDAVDWYQREGGSDRRLRIAHLDVVIGNVLHRVGDTGKALEYYGRARDSYADLGYDGGVAGATLNLGNIYQELDRYDEALASFAAAQAAAERLGDDRLRAMTEVNSCGALLDMGRTDSAMERCQAALGLARSIGVTRTQVHALLKIGEAQVRLDRPAEAAEALHEALPLADSLDDTALQRDVHSGLADAHEALGEPAAALAELRLAHRLERQLLDVTRLAEIERLETVRRSEQRELELELLRRQRRTDRITRTALLGMLGFAGVVIGLLVVGYRQRSRSATEIRDANALLQDAYARVDELSRTDDVTGLPNRRGLTPELERELQRAARSGREFTVALVDLDDFKSLNDAQGHQTGDRVLAEVAHVLRALIRAHDMVGRWGGDEFLLVLPETGIDGARRLCEALREKIAASDLGVGEPGRVTTVTAGLALCRGGDSSDDCLQRADAALYRGKAAGRNTVVS